MRAQGARVQVDIAHPDLGLSFFSRCRYVLSTRPPTYSLRRPRAATRTAIFEYLEGYYNSMRRHSTLGFLSPIDF